MSSVKQETLSGVKWSAIERFSVQGVTFLIGLVMARLLSPSDYGIVGMLGIFLAISQSFIDSGFGNALIRKIDRTDKDFCTVFYFNVAVSATCYVLLFLAAPYIAAFYSEPILKDVLRVLAINLCIGSLSAIPYAQLVIAVNFKAIAKCNLYAAVVSGLLGVTLAYNGFGVWSLVYQQICSSVISAIAIGYSVRWRPKAVFSRASFHELFGYGSKLLAAGLLHTLYSNMSTLVIGRFYTAKDLGYYSRGEGLAAMPCNNFTGVIQRVTFPILSQLQNDDERLIHVYRKYICIISIGIFFLMTLLASLAKPIVLLLLTKEWAESIIYLQVFCFALMFDHICAINLNLLQVKGRSDLFLRLEIIKKTISFAILVASIPFGVLAICLSKIVYTQIAVFINTYYTGKLFGLGYWTQVKDFGRYFLVAVLAALPAYGISTSDIHPAVSIVLGAVISGCLFVGYLKISRDVYFADILALVKERLAHK